MEIDVGCFYFIKDSFFDIIDDPELMKNKENGNKRPCYYCFKSEKYDDIIWFVPVSTKVEKYQKIYNKKVEKQIKLGKNPSIDTIIQAIKKIYKEYNWRSWLYVEDNRHEDTMIYLKQIEEISKNGRVVIKLVLGKDEEHSKNSIITLMKLNKITWNQTIRNRGKIIWKKGRQKWIKDV